MEHHDRHLKTTWKEFAVIDHDWRSFNDRKKKSFSTCAEISWRTWKDTFSTHFFGKRSNGRTRQGFTTTKESNQTSERRNSNKTKNKSKQKMAVDQTIQYLLRFPIIPNYRNYRGIDLLFHNLPLPFGLLFSHKVSPVIKLTAVKWSNHFLTPAHMAA